MADLLGPEALLRISNLGCGFTRRALLGLEPGARIWLEAEGEPVLFERMLDGADGRITRALKAVGPSVATWERLCAEFHNSVLEIGFIERPVDAGRSAVRWKGQDDIPEPAALTNNGAYHA